ncbi:hypothetical protein A374_10635 [Fictibacillus macauensis ZFHKF-1]|uniref:DUF2624 domain-containing protein n=1 Tax=Fictibacillus macauensis ZFHKF-1 TaxID=1196324 RepID=I8UEF7_9BACL|nr:DUF2624 family protein [Fictibacillus macauensis]EIT85193.1 hypothetical protein A374_10635 [Fictibacillus macauensis ZFHKF-1]
MNPIVAHMVNQKLNHLTPEELISLANQHNFPVTMQEATKVVHILRRYKINVNNATQRKTILQAIGQEVNQQKANMIAAMIDDYLNK